MATPTVVVETRVPEDIYLILQACGVFRENLADQSRRLLAMHFYRDRVLSLGHAAKLAGLTRWDFIDLLSENHQPVIDYSHDELESEFAAVKSLEAELRK